MICPHCGNEINGPADVVPIYVNLNNNGCNPTRVDLIINTVAGCNVPGVPPISVASGACNPFPVTTFIKL